MNLNNFNTLADKTRLTELAKEIAKAVMVDGVSVTEASRSFGISRQMIYNYIDTIDKADKVKVKMKGETYYLPKPKADYIEGKLKGLSK